MKTWNAVRNNCNKIALVSFRSHVNTSENFHFPSGLISCWSQINSVLPGGEFKETLRQRVLTIEAVIQNKRNQ